MPDTEATHAHMSAPEFATGVETLVNTTLGELLVAGAMRHPEDAGHLIAEAITAATGAANATPPGAAPKPGLPGIKTLVNRTLGDVLLGGALKHPQDAGQCIAETITAAIGAAKPTGGESEPHPGPSAARPDATPEIPGRGRSRPRRGARRGTGTGAGPRARAKPEPGPMPPPELLPIRKPRHHAAVRSKNPRPKRWKTQRSARFCWPV